VISVKAKHSPVVSILDQLSAQIAGALIIVPAFEGILTTMLCVAPRQDPYLVRVNRFQDDCHVRGSQCNTINHVKGIRVVATFRARVVHTASSSHGPHENPGAPAVAVLFKHSPICASQQRPANRRRLRVWTRSIEQQSVSLFLHNLSTHPLSVVHADYMSYTCSPVVCSSTQPCRR
jgi:hypothetical protein